MSRWTPLGVKDLEELPLGEIQGKEIIKAAGAKLRAGNRVPEADLNTAVLNADKREFRAKTIAASIEGVDVLQSIIRDQREGIEGPTRAEKIAAVKVLFQYGPGEQIELTVEHVQAFYLYVDLTMNEFADLVPEDRMEAWLEKLHIAFKNSENIASVR